MSLINRLMTDSIPQNKYFHHATRCSNINMWCVCVSSDKNAFDLDRVLPTVDAISATRFVIAIGASHGTKAFEALARVLYCNNRSYANRRTEKVVSTSLRLCTRSCLRNAPSIVRCGSVSEIYLGATDDAAEKLLSFLPPASHGTVHDELVAGTRRQLFPHRLQSLDAVLKDALVPTDSTHVRACPAWSKGHDA